MDNLIGVLSDRISIYLKKKEKILQYKCGFHKVSIFCSIILAIFAVILIVVVLLAIFFSMSKRSPMDTLFSMEASRSNISKTVCQNDKCTEDGVVCPSKNDKNSYHFMVLRNGLRVLLISQPDELMSAVSMNVAVGFFDDPPEYQGMAHLCEHMLFLGTKKYRDVDIFNTYVTSHEGFHNAETKDQETIYYFQISTEHLEPAIDIFAQFFISPVFDEDYLDKELSAINEEYISSFQYQEAKWEHLLKHISSRDHPFYKFGAGDLTTLNKSNVRDKLLQFYRGRYSSNLVR